MTDWVPDAACGQYTIHAVRPDTLSIAGDGSVQLWAEARYRVHLDREARRDVLRGALEMLGEDQALLHFGNFVGVAELGGRRLAVRSRRLASDQIDAMLDGIERRSAALPFSAASPVAATYRRDLAASPDVPYHAYAHLRDGMRALGPHDLPSAIGRILAHPHEQLIRGDPMPRPIGSVDRVDPDLFERVLTHPERLRVVDPARRIAASAVATALRNRLPETVDVRDPATSYDTLPNRFVLTAIDAAIRVARQFIAAAQRRRLPSMATNVSEAELYARRLERWRRHRIFDGLTPAREVPLHSTVLRGRPGYRELTRWYVDLLATTRTGDRLGIGPLLELRDAAEIYELWCFFEVLAAVVRVLQVSPVLRPLAADEWGVGVPRGYVAELGDTHVAFNRTYSATTDVTPRVGTHSYSLQLRPDITVRAPGRFHVFDAKLKRDIVASFSADDDDGAGATFKRADLYKMHTYRDALGAASVWILYPGVAGVVDTFSAPWDPPADCGPQGVGAVALVPGATTDHLDALVSTLIGA